MGQTPIESRMQIKYQILLFHFFLVLNDNIECLIQITFLEISLPVLILILLHHLSCLSSLSPTPINLGFVILFKFSIITFIFFIIVRFTWNLPTKDVPNISSAEFHLQTCGLQNLKLVECTN